MLFVLAANVHAIGYCKCSFVLVDYDTFSHSVQHFLVYTWTAAGIFSETIAAPKYQAGLAALISADILAFCSTSFFRRKYYQLFIATHVIGVISILVSVSEFISDMQ